jgi:hypothetical protein
MRTAWLAGVLLGCSSVSPESAPPQRAPNLAAAARTGFTRLDAAGMGRDPWVLSLPDTKGATLRLIPHDLAAGVRLDERTVAEVAPKTDAIHVKNGAGAELLYRLHDATAKTHFEWTVERGEALPVVADDGDGGLSIRDARGIERLFVAKPWAVDANGTRRDARMFFHADRLEIDLDTTGLAFPVLLDPYVGTARFVRVPMAPSARFAASMAERGTELLLYGGHGTTILGDTWKWTGTRWLELHPPASPPAREGAAMATLGDKTILFGGVDATLTKRLGDTWSFDGTTWTQLTPAHAPPPLAYGTLVHAGGKLALMGGKAPTDNTWVFDGVDWTETVSTPSPSFPIDAHARAMSDDGTTAFYVNEGQTWTFDGAHWTNRSAGAATPAAVNVIGPLGTKMVLLGALGNFEWNGTSWVARPPDANPPPLRFRNANGFAFSPYAGKLAAFGGNTLAGTLDDFFFYDATGFSQPDNLAAPPGRGYGALATVGDRAVLFGGWNYSVLGDTWEFDGSAWTQMSPATSPSPRILHAMGDGGGVAVLFGGTPNAKDPLDDTWTWDHTNWTRVTAGASPAGTLYAHIARSGTNTVMLDGPLAYAWTAGGWKPLPAKTPPRVGTVLTGADWSGFTSFEGKGLLVVPELGTQWSFDGTAWTKVDAQGFEQLGTLKSTQPLLVDGALDLGRVAFVLGHRLGIDQMETWVWNGTTWAQLGVQGLPALAGPSLTKLGKDVILYGGVDVDSTPRAVTYRMHVALSNGVSCETADDCDSGFCVGDDKAKVCCNSACNGATESCNLPDTRGTCAPILAACVGPSTLQAADGTKTDCGGYLCVAGACLQKCASSADCAGGKICDAPSAQCVEAPTAAPESGCACRAPRASDGSASLLLLAVLACRRARRTIR